MKRRHAQDTSVPVSRSREQIQNCLREWGCDRIMWDDDYKQMLTSLCFTWAGPSLSRKVACRITVDLSAPEDWKGTDEQAVRMKMRHMRLWIVSLFTAVESGIISDFEAIMPWIVDRKGRTVESAVYDMLESGEAVASDKLLTQ